MAKGLSPEEYVDKHARRLKSATEDIKRGVQNTAEAPGKLAVKAKEKMRNNFMAALDDGTWERNVTAVTLEDWQQATISKGIARIAAGVDAARDKNIRMAAKLLTDVNNAAAEANRMPKETFEDSINRMVAFSRAMKAKKGSYKQ